MPPCINICKYTSFSRYWFCCKLVRSQQWKPYRAVWERLVNVGRSGLGKCHRKHPSRLWRAIRKYCTQGRQGTAIAEETRGRLEKVFGFPGTEAHLEDSMLLYSNCHRKTATCWLSYLWTGAVCYFKWWHEVYKGDTTRGMRFIHWWYFKWQEVCTDVIIEKTRGLHNTNTSSGMLFTHSRYF